MAVSFSQHFTYKKIIRFTFPSIIMMIFISLYTIVDGIFVSNVAGNDAFAALNLIWPVISIIGAFGFMAGTGGSAYVAKLLGEEKQKEANEAFSLIIASVFALGIVLGLIAIIFMEDLGYLFGADDTLIEDCVTYGSILALMIPAGFLQNCMQTFLVTASRPGLGLGFSIAAGAANMILDYLFMAVLGMGIAGAAWATGISWIIGGLIPTLYFLFPNKSALRLVPFKWNTYTLSHTALNGSSEMVTNLSMSVIAILYNYELMRLIGSNGVVAYGIIQYVVMIFSGFFMGYAFGIGPVISYQYGAQNKKELHSLYTKSLMLIGISSVVILVISEASARLLSGIFVSYSDSLMNLTEHALRIYSLSFLLCGFNIFASSFFTALNNGPVSAAISFGRTFLFQGACIMLLPMAFGVTGIWWAMPLAEVLSLALSAFFLITQQKKYGY